MPDPSLDLGALAAHGYLPVMGALAVFGAHRLALLHRFRWRPAEEGAAALPEPPSVTVQLPLFNERTVAARAIRAAGALDWPRGRFELQVLDDSTDDTVAVVDREAAALRGQGIAVEVLRRTDRSGFKAGALAHGMGRAQGEFLAVFDADFLPRPDFLRCLMGHFADPSVGMVQARWEHQNRDESGLTRAEATLLDGHFVIEHTARFETGLFFNFNGTAGIWRRAAIESSGGWEHDTLTEDLDLSYRAQLGGWRFVYAPHVAAPAEVPPDIASFKSQQHRWAKGSVQVARKLGGRILRADVPPRVKLEACMHLTGNSGYPLVLALAVLLPFSVREQDRMGGLVHLAAFCVCTLSVLLFYDRSQRALGRTRRQRLRDVPAALMLGIGMSTSQTRAVLEGLLGGTGIFVRTPKRGDGASRGYRASLGGAGLPELALAAWFAWSLLDAASLGLWGTLPFLALFCFGFAWVGALSLGHWTRARTARVATDS